MAAVEVDVTPVEHTPLLGGEDGSRRSSTSNSLTVPERARAVIARISDPLVTGLNRRRVSSAPTDTNHHPLKTGAVQTNFSVMADEEEEFVETETSSEDEGEEQRLMERTRQSSINSKNVKATRELPKLVLHPDFDTSTSHLYKLFAVLDTNGDGELTYQQMREGFEAMNAFPDYTLEELDTLIEQIDTDKSQTICLSEFVSGMHEYAAQSVSGTEDYTCLCFDYAPEFVKRLMVVPEVVKVSDGEPRPVWDRLFGGEPSNQLDVSRLSLEPNVVDLTTFLKSHIKPPVDGRVRWLCFSGANAAAFVRIANAFNLHPLAIADVLEDRGRTKVDTYGNVIQILLGTIRPKEKNPNRVQLQHMHIFLLDNRTVITVEKTRSAFMDELQARIKYAGSKLRLNDASYLVHAIVDSAVDAVVPITRNYQRQINTVYKNLHGRGQFSLEHVQTTQLVYREVTKIIYWMRPLIRVVTQLSENLAATDKELERYFADLKDNVETIREHAKAMEKHAKSLNEDFVNHQQYKMNQVIYFLTMVTTIFIPGQFLSGVYGMNFDNMPELHSSYGYYVWWAVVCSIVICFLLLFYWFRWLPKRWDRMVL
eukprot:comp17679_c0_seq1/m.17498 comp17679_c0_seq1/g.17498  ORF comp17679_c0_seq1/g.17498 comp17679_c0_seq1/m.17498 type:complete len:596 (-) comp17679_c0_seq1:211-1998(-)